MSKKYREIDYLIERARYTGDDNLLLLLVRKKTNMQRAEDDEFEKHWRELRDIKADSKDEMIDVIFQ